MNPKLKPIGDGLLVLPTAPQATSNGGLFLPGSRESKDQEGIVLVLGTGRQNENGQRNKFDVSVGDHILFLRNVGHDIEVDGKKCLFIPEASVIAILS